MSGFRIDVELGDLGMDQLADGAEAAARPAAQAGAQVFYHRVKANVGKLGKRTGNLDKSIYQAFSKDNSPQGVAQYHVTWRGGRKKVSGEVIIGPAPGRAPHGHLVEYGHVQRYVVYIDKRGQWKTLVRPEMRGKPKPKANASLAVKDAYYVPLKGGPRIVGAQSFLRAARSPDVVRAARNAMIDRFWFELESKGLL